MPTSRSTRPTRTPRRCSQLPRHVIKAGRLLVEQGEIREESSRQDAARGPRLRPRGRGRYPRLVRGSLLDPLAELSGRGRQPSRTGGDRVNRTMTRPIPDRTSRAVADTFAEAFPMTAARAIVTADTPRLGTDRRPDDDRLRDQRDRLRRRGRHRARAARPTRRPTAGPASASWSSPSTATRSRRPWPTASASAS